MAFLREFGRFLWREKKWWLVPCLLAGGLLLVLALFSDKSPLAPLMYSFL